MVVRTHAQIMSDPLAYALRVVVVDIGGTRADDGDSNEGYRGNDSHMKTRGVIGQRTYESPEPWSELMVTDDIIEDDFERPWSRQAHHRLDQHAKEDEYQDVPIRPD